MKDKSERIPIQEFDHPSASSVADTEPDAPHPDWDDIVYNSFMRVHRFFENEKARAEERSTEQR